MVGQRLHAVLDAERVMDDLRRYLGNGLPPGASAFTGGWFVHLAGGCSRRQVANRFTAEDLVEVQTLSVTVPAPVALDLLEGPLGTQLRTSPAVCSLNGTCLAFRLVPCQCTSSFDEVALLLDFEWLFAVPWKLAHSGSS
ncbi:DUF6308 family protein [Streptomyces sp. NPDC004267]|uniref:DUF6308 family protein n=1 Tax=Streptomyces sp. NPDC004267 TaxID=3364694 RepID=UPI0036C0A46E